MELLSMQPRLASIIHAYFVLSKTNPVQTYAASCFTSKLIAVLMSKIRYGGTDLRENVLASLIFCLIDVPMTLQWMRFANSELSRRSLTGFKRTTVLTLLYCGILQPAYSLTNVVYFESKTNKKESLSKRISLMTAKMKTLTTESLKIWPIFIVLQRHAMPPHVAPMAHLLMRMYWDIRYRTLNVRVPKAVRFDVKPTNEGNSNNKPQKQQQQPATPRKVVRTKQTPVMDQLSSHSLSSQTSLRPSKGSTEAGLGKGTRKVDAQKGPQKGDLDRYIHKLLEKPR
eukprot:m.158088 g.158088  ORF g.158088 m.158088 type:complete len:284 (-) comp31078_c1_seq1:99-950(-)